MSNKILVGIVDDNPAIAVQLKENLSASGNIEVVFSASNGEAALSSLQTIRTATGNTDGYRNAGNERH